MASDTPDRPELSLPDAGHIETNRDQYSAEDDALLTRCRDMAGGELARFFNQQQISIGSTVAAATRVHQMIDEFVASWAQRVPIACSAGCSYCCSVQVYVSVPELILIRNYLQSLAKSKRRYVEYIQNAVRTAGSLNRGLTDAEQAAQARPCPFLIDLKCSVYPVRPSRCRRMHSPSHEACQRSYGDGTNAAQAYSPILSGVDGVIGAIETWLGLARLRPPVVELCCGFVILLDRQDALQSWVKGGSAFVSAIPGGLSMSDTNMRR